MKTPLPNILFYGSLGLFAWQLHGWIVALAMVAAYYVATAALSWVYLAMVARRSDDADADGGRFIKTMLRIRWVPWLLFMLGLALSKAELFPIGQ